MIEEVLCKAFWMTSLGPLFSIACFSLRFAIFKAVFKAIHINNESTSIEKKKEAAIDQNISEKLSEFFATPKPVLRYFLFEITLTYFASDQNSLLSRCIFETTSGILAHLICYSTDLLHKNIINDKEPLSKKHKTISTAAFLQSLIKETCDRILPYILKTILVNNQHILSFAFGYFKRTYEIWLFSNGKNFTFAQITLEPIMNGIAKLLANCLENLFWCNFVANYIPTSIVCPLSKFFDLKSILDIACDFISINFLKDPLLDGSLSRQI